MNTPLKALLLPTASKNCKKKHEIRDIDRQSHSKIRTT